MIGSSDPPSETPDQPQEKPPDTTGGNPGVSYMAQMRLRAEKMAANIDIEAGREASPETVLRAFFELRVHQIELEMQNEELRRTQQELLQSRERYQDLYDSAPVGYVTLDEDGRIVEANLTSAGILGVAKAALVGLPLTHFILADDQDTFYLLRRRLFESRAAQLGSLRLCKPGRDRFPVRLVASLAKGPDGVLETRVTIVLADADGPLHT